MNVTGKILPLLIGLLLAACGQQKPLGERAEDREAKRLLQGVWVSSDNEDVVFKLQGDSVYFPDSTSQTAYFCVVDDSLCLGDATYHIERHTDHLLWFQAPDGDIMKLVKSDEPVADGQVFHKTRPHILTLTEVLKRDTVVLYNGERYHLYVAVNPTKYKVVRQALNDDGLQVDNVYYDNIIHLSIFHGSAKIFSQDMRKQDYVRLVPEQFLRQSILNDMTFQHVAADGFHFSASVCIPDDASCYQIDHVVSLGGQLTTRLSEN